MISEIFGNGFLKAYIFNTLHSIYTVYLCKPIYTYRKCTLFKLNFGAFVKKHMFQVLKILLQIFFKVCIEKFILQGPNSERDSIMQGP
jgi:hypothetical protein